MVGGLWWVGHFHVWGLVLPVGAVVGLAAAGRGWGAGCRRPVLLLLFLLSLACLAGVDLALGLQLRHAVLEVAHVFDGRLEGGGGRSGLAHHHHHDLFFLPSPETELSRPRRLTWRMASLCISPVHAGIMSFSTPNSSFILDLRRRSIRLWAVFRAIFLPAALVADGCCCCCCFFLPTPEAGAAGAPLALVSAAGAGAGASSSSWPSCGLGFIWMILRERVGGGGSAKASLPPPPAAADGLRLDLTASAGWTGYGAAAVVVVVVLGGVWTGEPGCLFSSILSVPAWRGLLGVIAGSGSSKAICRVAARCFAPSWAEMSVEDAGVGGRAARGMSVRVRVMGGGAAGALRPGEEWGVTRQTAIDTGDSYLARVRL